MDVARTTRDGIYMAVNTLMMSTPNMPAIAAGEGMAPTRAPELLEASDPWFASSPVLYPSGAYVDAFAADPFCAWMAHSPRNA